MASEVVAKSCDGGGGSEGGHPASGQPSVRVVCNGVPALFLIDESNFACQCPPCLRKSIQCGPQVYTPTEYERHAGMAASKKWKYSVRIDDPAHNPDGGILTIGKWLDDQGLTSRTRPVKGGRGGGVSTKPTFGRAPSGGVQSAASTKPRAAWPWGASPDLPSSGNEARAGGAHDQLQSAGRSGIPIPAGLLTPNGAEKRRWLLTQEQVAEKDHLQHPEVPSTPVQHKVSRVGDQFQAPLPKLVKRTTELMAAGDPRGGTPGPSEAEALQVAREVEKVAADDMPRDAIADVHEEEPDPRLVSVLDVRPGLLDRTQRVRRRPEWLKGNINLYGIRRRQRRDSSAREAEAAEGKRETETGEGSEDDANQAPRVKRSFLPRVPSALTITAATDMTSDVAPEEPEVMQWRMSASGASLFMKVCVKGVMFSGELPVESTPRLEAVRKPRGQRKRSITQCSDTSLDAHLEPSQGGSQADGSGVEAADAVGGDSMKAMSGKRPRVLGAVKVENGAGVEQKDTADAGPAQPLSKRHAKAEERYRKLAEDGAPPDTLCSLCLLEEDEVVEYDVSDGGEQAVRPLGKLLLVRTSTITHAWAHETCARWCPEVREVAAPKGASRKGAPTALEGLAEAVRRGRRIKCTECGQRGATLGCHAKNCRKSYHLPCACVAGCLLEEDTMASFCSDHAEIHLRAREEAARSAERSLSLKADPSDATASKSSCAMSTESSAVEEDEDKLAADILMGAAQRHAEGDRGAISLPLPRRPASAGTAAQSRHLSAVPIQVSKPAAAAPVRGGAPVPVPLSGVVASQGADFKPPIRPGTTGSRTQRPRPPGAKGALPSPLPMQPQVPNGAPGRPVAVLQPGMPPVPVLPGTGPTGGLYAMVGVPPAPVRSKRASLADAAQNGMRARSPAPPGAGIPPLTSPPSVASRTAPPPPSNPGPAGQREALQPPGSGPVLFQTRFPSADGAARHPAATAPADKLMAGSAPRDVGHCQPPSLPANARLPTPAPGPSRQ
eukprot:jgi/Tetstr1/424733/TSEL_015251.t1